MQRKPEKKVYLKGYFQVVFPTKTPQSHEKHRKDEADHIKSIKSLLANSVAYIKDNLNVLDASVQDVIRKIDSNQASIVDLSKYHKLN